MYRSLAFIIVLVFCISNNLQSQQRAKGYLYLSDGSVVHGTILQYTPKGFLIQKDDGSVYPAWKQLQCAHLLGRWKGSIRWDEENAIGACGGCHMTLDRSHLAKESFLLERLGQERYDLLKARERVLGKPDVWATTLYLKEKIH